VPKLDIEKYREDWMKATQWEKPFYIERPPLFGPAAAAQEGYGACQVMIRFQANWIPWQYTNFVEEGSSFHETAFIGDWSSLIKFHIKGPDAHRFLTYHCTNDLSRFETTQLKHAIQTNEQGKVAGEGILIKISDDEYRYQGGGGYWMHYLLQQGQWKAEAKIDSPDTFVFHVQGPKSLAILEKVTRESLRDIRYLHTRMSSIGDMKVRILRMGVTGELGYEVHGRSEDGNDVWEAIYEAGKEFGIKRMGRRSQIIGHIEAGIPTVARDFYPAAGSTPAKSKVHSIVTTGGSYEWSDISELMHSPFELGWEKEVSLNTHEFLGRDALSAEVKSGGPARRLVGLVWNSDDIIDLYGAFFRDGPIPTPMEMPRESAKLAMDPDKVLKDGKVVGCSTSRVYSPYLRKMISLCTIDKGLTEPETKVTLVWGDRGGPQKEIRATVIRLPFKEDKRRIDVSKL
jgi:vanillate/3-O-methylgallate O-demethylase